VNPHFHISAKGGQWAAPVHVSQPLVLWSSGPLVLKSTGGGLRLCMSASLDLALQFIIVLKED